MRLFFTPASQEGVRINGFGNFLSFVILSLPAWDLVLIILLGNFLRGCCLVFSCPPASLDLCVRLECFFLDVVSLFFYAPPSVSGRVSALSVDFFVVPW